MDAHTLRQTYLQFFEEHDHAVIGGAPLVPKDDASVLFTTAGMHPLVPFLLGEPHPSGRRLASVQKCLRTDDIDEVGDNRHNTFFEMLGNWSLGDYGKEQSIRWSYQFLADRLGLDPQRLRVTCFAGDADAPRDDETAAIWRSLGISEHHIFLLPKDANWWGPVGTTGPCGPDTEMFYDINPDGPPEQTLLTHPERFPEIWNNVFMQYDRQPDGTYQPLPRLSIDTGMGLERTLMVVQNVPVVYQIDVFQPLIEKILTLAPTPDDFAVRVIADHSRAAVFVLAEGVVPGNVEQPYIVRRLIRRAIRYGREIGIERHFLGELAEAVIDTYSRQYPELISNRERICGALDDEETLFGRTLARGRVAFERAVEQPCASTQLSGTVVFRLYDTYGFPPELTAELAEQRGLDVDMAGFQEAYASHQEKSRQGAARHFKGGLSDHHETTTRLHTATHLLHESLRRVLGTHVEQRGSNITPSRLRFDFSHPDRLTAGQLDAVEALVNAQIEYDLPVSRAEMTLDEARQAGAIGLFEGRYGERVKVYSIGDFSREVCGGPHVEHTGELGRFEIMKEQAVGAGVRRIRAVLR